MKTFFTLLLLFIGHSFAGHAQETNFVKGADVGFLQGQERRGVVFHDRNGRERECLELLKNDYQMSAIRMRVWVNPRGGDCDKNELLAMAKRVKALGMDLMVNFHYSNTWADPKQQGIPAAWKGHSYKQMKRDLREHTIDALSLLKQNGITPRWVQVGNETANGMLWPMGHIEKNPKQYAGFIGAAYDAVKEVFPESIVIIHLDRGHKQSLYDYNLDIVKKYGGKWDMIGMSLYPYWARKDHPELNADSIITDCMRNIRYCSKKYGCDVMIVETGFEVDEQHPELMEEGRRQLTRIVREAQTETDGHCRGVFYWEPQCLPGGYKLGAFNSKAQPTAIMEGFVEAPMVKNVKPLWIQNGDRQIYGELFTPHSTSNTQYPSPNTSKKPIAIIAHGFNGTYHYGRNYFDVMQKLGYQCYVFDFPCGSVNSRSDNNTLNMSILDEQSDLRVIVNYFHSKGHQHIVLIGESQGGLVSALTAAQMKDKVSQLVLVFPALCIPQNWRARYPKLSDIPEVTELWGVKMGRRFFEEIHDMNTFDIIGKYRGPVLIVQGDKDQVVLIEDSKRAQKLYKDARLHIIPGAGHGFKPKEFQEEAEQLEKFLKYY